MSSAPDTPLQRMAVRWILGVVIVLTAATLLFARTVDRDLNHDEHQFLAPAALMSREGLQPWRDYPLFHLPNLVFVYAAADWLTGDLIFGAKLVCFAATTCVLIGLVIAALRTRSLLVGGLLAVTALLLLLGDPLFRYTAGKTWNHEVPTALLLGAVACLCAAVRRHNHFLVGVAGVLGGLAVGCRLTFAPILVGLVLFAWLAPLPIRWRSIAALILTFSATTALAPSLYYLVSQQEAFIFGNFEFPRLRLLDPNDTRAHETIVWWRKVRYFLKEIVRESWPVFILWAAVAVRPGWRWLRRKERGDITAAAVLVLLPFVLLGCFAPSRYQYQHYFVFIPLLVFGTIGAIRLAAGKKQLGWTVVCGVVTILVSVRAAKDYKSGVVNLGNPSEWFSSKARAVGERLRAEISKPGRVLTLAPVVPLAGDLRIYPEFATGVFAWRSAHHVPSEKRRRLHIVAPEDLAEYLRTDPPSAVLTGVEDPEEEEPLVKWAEQQGYRPVDMKKKRKLWLPPAGE